MAVLDRVKRVWNAFQNTEQPKQDVLYGLGPTYNVKPDRTRLRYTNERSIISSIYTRLSVDLAAIDVRHVMFGRK